MRQHEQLCGQKYTNVHKLVALITILSGTGEVVEEREAFTNGDDDYTSSSVARCIQWNGGVALIGETRDKQSQYMSSWMMRLDGNGAEESKTVFAPDTVFFAPLVTADRNLFVISYGRETKESGVVKLNEKGEIVARRALEANQIYATPLYPMRSLGPDGGVEIVEQYAQGDSYRIHDLNERLERNQRPRRLGIFNLNQGFGIRRPDQSLVLFGSTSTRSGSRGAVEWVSRDGEVLASAVFPQLLESVTFGDAIALDNDRFVVVACENAYGSRTRGLFMSWISLK